MKDYDPDRRKFLKVMISLPVAVAISGELEITKSKILTPSLNPEQSFKKLIFLLGPWSATDKEEAEDLAWRFLKAKHNVDAYLPESSELVQSLASRFPKKTMAIKEINLQNLPAKEQELLLRLVKHLYSFIEVRFTVSNEPPWGECQGDGNWHTQTPSKT